MDDFIRQSSDERRVFFEQTAARMRLSPQIIEKDFWVCWTLKELFRLPEVANTLIFKGGTSLSKVYRMIERFSEDIDVSLDRASLGFGGDADPEAGESAKEQGRRLDKLRQACQEKIVGQLKPSFEKVIATKFGQAAGWSVALDEADPDRQTLLYAYPSGWPDKTAGYVRAAVKIEMGARSDHWPSEQAEISSYVAQQFPAAFKAPSFKVKVLAAERTFWEKATLLHAEQHRPADKTMPLRLSRHYYDVARLITSGLGEKAARDLELLRRVVEHKKVFFRSAWAHYGTAQQGSLRLSPTPDRLKSLEADYDKMQEMFFGDRPAFAEILRVIRDWETGFNQTPTAKKTTT
jgi:predicted nucleotidyltransferase component of viral defense system